MLDFRHQTFISLCKIGSYTKTAEQLHITQPAVTQHIKYLEDLYQAKLFDYQGKVLTLTEQGQLLYEFATTVHTDSQQVKKVIAQAGSKHPLLSFGATRTIGEYVMPSILRCLLAQESDLHCSMLVANTQTLLGKMRDGEISFALLEGFFDKTQYGHRLFSREEFIAICSPQSSLARRRVKFSYLLNQRVILREEGSGSLKILDQELHKKNLTQHSFRRSLVVGNIHAIKELVAQGVGISFLYRAAVEKELAQGVLEEIDIIDFHLTREFNMVFLENSFHTPEYLQWFERFKELRGK